MTTHTGPVRRALRPAIPLTALAALAAGLAAPLATALPAHATETHRWASPTGTGTACTEVAPCDLDTAVESPAVAHGDEVVVRPGAYTVEGLEVLKGIDLHGQEGQPTPTITTTGAGIGLYISATATVHDLRLTGTQTGTLLYTASSGIVLDRIVAFTSVPGALACNIARSVTVRDSICWSSGPNGVGLGANASVGTTSVTAHLRNVTAVGAQYGIGFGANAVGGLPVFDVDARNVIARGGVYDVRAGAVGGAVVRVALDHSSFATRDEGTQGDGSVASVTEPGSGTNQTAAPEFVDAAHGDFHQTATSPTVDAGALDEHTGALDVDGEPRSLRGTAAACPALPDIGADELATALECAAPGSGSGGPAPTGPQATAPETTLTRAPARRVTTERARARVRFAFASSAAGTFECALDGARFAPCGSPVTRKVVVGRHTFRVRAVSTAGLADPTPAEVTFRVRRR